MGVESIDEILDKTETEDLKKILAVSKVEHNEIVKRTPVEEEAVEIFEYDNLFGVF